MTIEDRVAYLSSLTFLLDFHEKLGGPRNKLILREFEENNEILLNELKEKYDETRKSVERPHRIDETRTDFSSGIPRRG